MTLPKIQIQPEIAALLDEYAVLAGEDLRLGRPLSREAALHKLLSSTLDAELVRLRGSKVQAD